MRNIFLIILPTVILLSSIALATTVTTQDGKGFTVTNDYGQTHSMTMYQINQQESQANSIVQDDGIKDLKDGEALADWMYVQQSAVNAQVTLNQTNGI